MKLHEFITKSISNGWSEQEATEYYEEWKREQKGKEIKMPFEFLNPLLQPKIERRDYVVKNGHIRDY
jgi:hypothetical protein